MISNVLERKASALNGLIIVGSCVLGVIEATRPWGIGLAILMGAGLIFSGWVNFCGWYQILGPRGPKHPGQSSFWNGRRDAYIKGVIDDCNSQINNSANLAKESVSEVERKQHLDHANALRAERQRTLEKAKHAVY
ncbi:MAG: DUF2892 domain-containing protein [Planctomycetota bacterium]